MGNQMRKNSEPANGKEYDFSGFNEYFNLMATPGEIAEVLGEMLVEYLELSLYAEKGFSTGNTGGGRSCAHSHTHSHAFHLNSMIE